MINNVKSEKAIQIVLRALRRIDHRLTDHGERVAYILYMLLVNSDKYSEKKIIDICVLGLFHDIGAYKTEDINSFEFFEQEDYCKHSIYGYLHLKYFSPLKKLANTVLYHHFDYQTMKQIGCDNKDIINLLYFADKLDNYLQLNGEKYLEKYLCKHDGEMFAKYNINLFWQANKKGDLLRNYFNGDYLKIILEIFENAKISRNSLRDYLKMLVFSIDFKSEYTVTHSVKTAYISVALAQKLKLPKSKIYNIYYAALVHDLGKIKTPKEILNKNGKLAMWEMQKMQEHVLETEKIIKNCVNDDIYKIAISHHEKLDGKGYPYGLRAVDLDISQRVLAVADIISALTDERSYKESFAVSKVNTILGKMASENKICGKVVQVQIENQKAIMDFAQRASAKILGKYLDIKKEYTILKVRLPSIAKNADCSEKNT